METGKRRYVFVCVCVWCGVCVCIRQKHSTYNRSFVCTKPSHVFCERQRLVETFCVCNKKTVGRLEHLVKQVAAGTKNLRIDREREERGRERGGEK